MIAGRRTAHVATDTGWVLDLYEVELRAGGGKRYRAEVWNPENVLVMVKAMAKDTAECFESVRNFFRYLRLDHTATVLRAMVEAEMKS